MFEWVLLIYMNGYVTEHSRFPTSRECDVHMKTVTRAFQQSGTDALVRCHEIQKEPPKKPRA